MKINKNQKVVIITALIIIMIMGIVPPWKKVLNAKGVYSEIPLGYNLLFSPPIPEGYYSANIDITRLCIQWLLVIILAGAAYLLLSDKKN